MLILIFICTILYGMFANQKKHFWLWCTILLIIMINTSINFADYDAYNKYYLLVGSGSIEPGYHGIPIIWYYLCLLFNKLNLSYNGMMAIILLISMFLINYRIKDLNINKNVFWSLFIIFPGLIQCIQLRFFLGTSIVLFGLIPLLNEKKYSLIKYVLCVIIAYYTHASCAIFTLFAFVPLFKRIGTKGTLFISLISVFLIYFGLQYIPDVISPFIPSIKFERYFVSGISETNLSWFIQIALVWLVMFLTQKAILSNVTKYFNEYINENDKNINSYNNIGKATILLIITIPFLMFDRNFHRFLEIGYVIMYILVSFYLMKFIKKRENKFSIVLLSILILCVVTYIYTPYETVLKPLFTFSGFHSLFMN